MRSWSCYRDIKWRINIQKYFLIVKVVFFVNSKVKLNPKSRSFCKRSQVGKMQKPDAINNRRLAGLVFHFLHFGDFFPEVPPKIYFKLCILVVMVIYNFYLRQFPGAIRLRTPFERCVFQRGRLHSKVPFQCKVLIHKEVIKFGGYSTSARNHFTECTYHFSRLKSALYPGKLLKVNL